jgi:hypothetical protein
MIGVPLVHSMLPQLEILRILRDPTLLLRRYVIQDTRRLLLKTEIPSTSFPVIATIYAIRRLI